MASRTRRRWNLSSGDADSLRAASARMRALRGSDNASVASIRCRRQSELREVKKVTHTRAAYVCAPVRTATSACAVCVALGVLACGTTVAHDVHTRRLTSAPGSSADRATRTRRAVVDDEPNRFQIDVVLRRKQGPCALYRRAYQDLHRRRCQQETIVRCLRYQMPFSLRTTPCDSNREIESIVRAKHLRRGRLLCLCHDHSFSTSNCVREQ
jgi:hypothetical protein